MVCCLAGTVPVAVFAASVNCLLKPQQEQKLSNSGVVQTQCVAGYLDTAVLQL